MGTFDKYLQLADKTYFNRLGKVTKIVGLTIESVGPNAKLNDLCRIIIDREQNISTMAEVVGFRDKHLLLMPFESVEGIGVGCIVENTGHPLTVKVGEELLGHTLDGIGRPTDVEELLLSYDYPVEALPPDPMARKIIDEVLPLGVKAVDGLITVGKGQRYFRRIRCWKKYITWYVCEKYKSGYQRDCIDWRAWKRSKRVCGTRSW